MPVALFLLILWLLQVLPNIYGRLQVLLLPAAAALIILATFACHPIVAAIGVMLAARAARRAGRGDSRALSPGQAGCGGDIA